jgi:antitoxin CptB
VNEIVQDDVIKDARVHHRIRWRARRGLLENDLLLKPFLASRLESLSADEIQTLDRLLLLGDNELLDVLMGRKGGANAATDALVAQIRKT